MVSWRHRLIHFFRPWWTILLFAGTLYVLNVPGTYVGYANDDSTYIIGAQELMHGHYRAIHTPGEPFMSYFPPGFSFFLAPFVKCVAPAWSLLKIVSIGITLATILFTWLLLRSWLPEWPRRLVVTMYALNSATIFQSGVILSDLFFLLLTLVLFWLLQQEVENRLRVSPYLLGLLLGWACLVRLEGFILVIAAGFGLGYLKRWRPMMQMTTTALLLWGAFILNAYLSHHMSGQLQNVVTSIQWAGEFRHLLGNMDEWSHLLFVHVLLSFRFLSRNVFGLILNVLLITVVLACIGMGFRMIALKRPKDGSLVAVACFCIIYFLIHVIWSAFDQRYSLPVLPFLLAFFISGAHHLWTRYPSKALQVLALVVLTMGYGSADVHLFRRIYATPPPLQAVLPRDTFQWIRTNTSPHTLFVSQGATLYLYTQRQSVAKLIEDDAESFRYRLLKEGIGAIWLQPWLTVVAQGAPVNDGEMLGRTLRWVTRSPEYYRRVFANSAESSVVFFVVPDPTFLKAYELYREALSTLQNQSIPQGLLKLESALSLCPHFVGALNAYAITLILTQQRLPFAEKKLHEALRWDASNSLTLFNLGRLYELQRKQTVAEHYLHLALHSTLESTEYAYLVPMINQHLEACQKL